MTVSRNGRRELISRATRRAVREMMSGTVLREIDGVWQDENFAPGPEPDPPVGGQRVSLFQSYMDSVDWTDAGQVARALRVFEVALRDCNREYLGTVVMMLQRDGYRLQEDGRITGGPVVVVREGALSGLTDPAAIREHLDRISRAIEDDDAAQAIGSAKELIESTAKVVLHERGESVNDRDDLPELVRAAQLAIGVHPTSPSPGPDSSDAVKKILGGHQRHHRLGRAAESWLWNRPRTWPTTRRTACSPCSSRSCRRQDVVRVHAGHAHRRCRAMAEGPSIDPVVTAAATSRDRASEASAPD